MLTMADNSEGQSMLRERNRNGVSPNQNFSTSTGISDSRFSHNAPLSTTNDKPVVENQLCHISSLPKWLQDNSYLHKGHRPASHSFMTCFQSIFSIHTETGNIWTHLIGCFMFIIMAVRFLNCPPFEIQYQDRIIFSAFFAGAILCLGMSFTYHTVKCHSEKVFKRFKKFDYCGIALLILGSFVPWLYYGFYCETRIKVIYLTMIICLGVGAVIVSLWDKFGEPSFRPLRAGVFIAFGLSGVFPGAHQLLKDGWMISIYQASLGWLFLMAVLYISGAVFYAMRVPERYYPGKCDICFQSHQIFHTLVVVAALVHYHGITVMAKYKLTVGECPQEPFDF